MKRSPLKQIGVSAVAALLAVGCAAGRSPQQSPSPGANAAVSSTTGDVDACALALGNADTTGAAGGGGGTTGAGGGGTTGITGTSGAAGGNPGAAGTSTTGIGNGTTGTTGGQTGTAGAGGTTGTSTEATANGVMIGNVALVGLPSADNLPLTGASGATGAGTGGPTAIDRIRASCRGVTEIRVVTDAADRARLAQISSSIRKGQPITAYINDIARMSAKATVFGGAAGGGGAPAPGSYGTPPGETGPGQTGTAPNR